MVNISSMFWMRQSSYDYIVMLLSKGYLGQENAFTVKHVISGHSKIDKTKIFKTNGSLMKVKSIAECSLGAFCNTFDLH